MLLFSMDACLYLLAIKLFKYIACFPLTRKGKIYLGIIICLFDNCGNIGEDIKLGNLLLKHPSEINTLKSYMLNLF